MYARQVTELITGKDYLKNPYVEATEKDEEVGIDSGFRRLCLKGLDRYRCIICL